MAGCAIVLVGLWFLLKPVPTGLAGSGPDGAQAYVFQFDLNNGELAGPDKLVVRQGDTLRLEVRSDVDDLVHIHGLERQLPLRAGRSVALDLVAQRSGRFAIELHQLQAHFATLEVYPR